MNIKSLLKSKKIIISSTVGLFAFIYGASCYQTLKFHSVIENTIKQQIITKGRYEISYDKSLSWTPFVRSSLKFKSLDGQGTNFTIPIKGYVSLVGINASMVLDDIKDLNFKSELKGLGIDKVNIDASYNEAVFTFKTKESSTTSLRLFNSGTLTTNKLMGRLHYKYEDGFDRSYLTIGVANGRYVADGLENIPVEIKNYGYTTNLLNLLKPNSRDYTIQIGEVSIGSYLFGKVLYNTKTQKDKEYHHVQFDVGTNGLGGFFKLQGYNTLYSNDLKIKDFNGSYNLTLSGGLSDNPVINDLINQGYFKKNDKNHTTISKITVKEGIIYMNNLDISKMTGIDEFFKSASKAKLGIK